MENYIKEFLDYLKYIKFLNDESVITFISVYNAVITGINQKIKNPPEQKLYDDKSLNNIFTNPTPSEYEIIIRTIFDYISSLSPNQLKVLAKGIIDGYNENKNKIKYKFTFRLIEIYENNSIKYYLKKWINTLKKEKDNEILNVNIEKNNNYNNNNNSNNIPNYNNENYNKNINNNIPNYNKENYNQNNNNNIPNYNNNNQNNNLQNKNENKKVLYKANINKILYENKKRELEGITRDFIDRQEKYYTKIQKNREKAYYKNEEEMQLLCSFSPRLNNKNLNIKSKYQSPMIPKKTKSKTSVSSNRITSPNNNSKIISERLYNDYSKMQRRKVELQKEIDNQRGITFKPKSYTTNSGYTIESNFGERNKKLLEERQNFAFVYDYLRQKKYNEGKIGKKSDDLLQNYLMNNNNKYTNYNELLPESQIDNEGYE